MTEELVITPNNPFATESWNDNAPVIVENSAEETATQINSETNTEQQANTAQSEPEKKKEEASTQSTTAEQVVTEPYYKKLGFEKEEDVETEITTLREKASKAFEYKNEESKKIAEYINKGDEGIDDLYKFLSNKKKVQKLSTADLSDKNVASELVKFGIQNENPQLNDDEVEFLFNEKYSIPSKPVQDELEGNEDYEARVSAWEGQKANIEKRMIIEAKIAQPKLAQLSSELVLPDIQKESNQNGGQLSQEELAMMDEVRNKFLTKLESDYKNFNGFETKYKDEEVEIPVSFGYTEEEKLSQKAELADFDVNEFLDKRWFENGVPNVTKMMEDISLLRDKEKIFQKVANEVGSKMKEHYIKVKANVSVNGSQQSTFNPDGNKSEMDKQIEYIWSQK